MRGRKKSPTSKHPSAYCYFTLTIHRAREQHHVSLHWLAAVPNWVWKGRARYVKVEKINIIESVD